jgi:hypothetical protein
VEGPFHALSVAVLSAANPTVTILATGKDLRFGIPSIQRTDPNLASEAIRRMGSTHSNWEQQAPPVSLARQSPEELQEESRKIRRLQMVVNMVTQVIAQDPSLSVEDASEMVADTRRMALGMFPDKELAFNLLFWPRLQRLMRERYRMQ